MFPVRSTHCDPTDLADPPVAPSEGHVWRSSSPSRTLELNTPERAGLGGSEVLNFTLQGSKGYVSRAWLSETRGREFRRNMWLPGHSSSPPLLAAHSPTNPQPQLSTWSSPLFLLRLSHEPSLLSSPNAPPLILATQSQASGSIARPPTDTDGVILTCLLGYPYLNHWFFLQSQINTEYVED